MRRYIAFDCETGGLHKECSLLTLYMVVLDSDMVTVLGELDLKIKPDGGAPFVCTGEALQVNKINLTEHEKVAIAESTAGSLLYKFLDKFSDQGSIKLMPIGHNVFFDEEFIKSTLIKPGNWNNFVSYRRLDTGVIAEYLRTSGMIPDSVRGGLQYLCDFFNIPLGAQAHTAKGDTIATVKLLRKMIERTNSNESRKKC